MILCGELHLTHGEKLNCQFYKRECTYVRNLYYCSVTSLDNSLNNMSIDGFSGDHMTFKTVTDVNGIRIHDTNTTYIPANLGFLYKCFQFLCSFK